MKTNWNVLLGCEDSLDAISNFAFNNVSVNETSEQLAYSASAGEFRNLVRSHGAQYARRLARKALRYRGYDVV